jgi:hypothetical protein
MTLYQLRFTIPQQRQGDRQTYQSFAVTVQRMLDMIDKTLDGATVKNVEVTTGSVRGVVKIEARDYAAALSLCCRKAPIIDLEWHLEECIDPTRVQAILLDAMRQP